MLVIAGSGRLTPHLDGTVHKLPARSYASGCAPQRVAPACGPDRRRRGAGGTATPARPAGRAAGGGAGRRPCDRHVARRPRRRPRHPGELHLGRGGRAVRARRGRSASAAVRKPVTIAMTRHGQGAQHEPPRRARRRRAGDAERRGPAAHPLHGHLRPGAGVDDLALPGPGGAAARRAEHRLHRRQLHRPALRRRRRWRDLRPRRAAADRRLARSPATGATPTGRTSAAAAVRALSQYRNLPVYVVNSRFDANVCSNGGALSSIGVSWTVLNSRFTPTGRSAPAPTRPDPARPAAAAAARSTTTAIG